MMPAALVMQKREQARQQRFRCESWAAAAGGSFSDENSNPNTQSWSAGSGAADYPWQPSPLGPKPAGKPEADLLHLPPSECNSFIQETAW